ncbi:XkdW family protein [Bacillus swezeyi]|uniref:XkdW family protein n=1 Tax=Bacillus swezeyi TaxID=1925020 RepID=UPI0027DE1F15|nr:XkdW family protein [Bacillus swezeyi]
MIIYDAIMYKYPNAIPNQDFEIRAENGNVYISKWNLSESAPSQEELELWWEESQQYPAYIDEDPLKTLGEQLSQERIARKKIERANQTMENELAALKLELFHLKGGQEK